MDGFEDDFSPLQGKGPDDNHQEEPNSDFQDHVTGNKMSQFFFAEIYFLYNRPKIKKMATFQKWPQKPVKGVGSSPSRACIEEPREDPEVIKEWKSRQVRNSQIPNPT